MRHSSLETIQQTHWPCAAWLPSAISSPTWKPDRRRPDSPSVAEATVRAAVAKAAAEIAPELPMIAGGKSFGGRMTSQAAAASSLPGVRGLAFLGFPLHPPGRPGPVAPITSPGRDAHALSPGNPGPVCPGRSDHRRMLAPGQPCDAAPHRGRRSLFRRAQEVGPHRVSGTRRAGRHAGPVGADPRCSVRTAR